jgi:hypothetical protein
LVGGVIVLASRLRPVAVLGAWLAALSGAWFAVGSVLIGLWSHGTSAGLPLGGTVVSAAEQVSFFAGLGVVIVFVAALVLGRLTVVAARDVAAVADQAAADQAAADRTAADRSGAGPAGSSRVPVATAAAADPVTVPARRPARKPMRAMLTKVVPAKSAAGQPAADETPADETPAEQEASAGAVSSS